MRWLLMMAMLPATGLAAQSPTADPRPQVLWRVEGAGAVRATPRVHDGTVYAAWTDGAVRAIALERGEVRWTYRAPAPVVSTPAVDDGYLVFVDRANTVHALDLEGKRLWSRPTGPDLPRAWGFEGWDYHSASPVISDGVVYVGSGDGFLYSIRLLDGAVQWQAPAGGRIRSTPALSDGTVFVATGEGSVLAFGRDDGAQRWSADLRGARLDAAEWGFDRSMVQALLVIGSHLIAGSRDGGLYALHERSGEVVWRHQDDADSTAWVVGAPVATPDGTGLVFGRTGSSAVYQVARATGTMQWRTALRGMVFGSPLVRAEGAIVADDAGWLTKLDTAGRVRWTVRVGTAIHGSPVAAGPGGRRTVLGTDDGYVLALGEVAGPMPQRAFYADSARSAWSTFGSRPAERAVIEHLREYGYVPLSHDELADFLRARLADGAPSVVVFGIDDLPHTLDEAGVRGGLLIRYLGAGGKVVWTGMPPAAIVRDSATGAIRGVDRGGPGRLLGVAFDSATTDLYAYGPTRQGLIWGLDVTGVAGHGIPIAPHWVSLLEDERGRAVAWYRPFGRGSGLGFVFLPAGLARQRPDLVRHVAEAGVSHVLR